MEKKISTGIEKHAAVARGAAIRAALHLWIIFPGFGKRILKVRKRTQVDSINGKIIAAQFVNHVTSSLMGVGADVI